MTERCDQEANCRDESDEIDCKTISRNANYNKKIPPFTGNNKAKVNVSIDFLSINDIRNTINNVRYLKTIRS